MNPLIILHCCICFYMLSSCSKSEKICPPPILGTWQLVEEEYWTGIPSLGHQWRPIENGHIYIFDSKDKYRFLYSNEYRKNDCYGRYKVLEDTIVFKSGKCSFAKNLDPNLQYNLYSFDYGYLLLSPLPICDEGCTRKYKKIE